MEISLSLPQFMLQCFIRWMNSMKRLLHLGKSPTHQKKSIMLWCLFPEIELSEIWTLLNYCSSNLRLYLSEQWTDLDPGPFSPVYSHIYLQKCISILCRGQMGRTRCFAWAHWILLTFWFQFTARFFRDSLWWTGGTNSYFVLFEFFVLNHILADVLSK